MATEHPRSSARKARAEAAAKEQAAEVAAIQQEVEVIREGVNGAVAGTSLDEKVETLRQAIHLVTEEVESWRGTPRGVDPETFGILKDQVEAVQTEWQSLAGGLQSQRDRLDSLLQSFPGAAEFSTLHGLSLRMGNLEELVEDLLDAQRDREVRRNARLQMWVSVAALVATVALWGGFILNNILTSN